MNAEKTVITFGTFDLFHVGHLNILKRSAAMGRVIVGVSTDLLTVKKKGRPPVYSQAERIDIIRSVRFVDSAFFEESLEEKREYIKKYRAEILVMGDDWKGKFDEFRDLAEVVYFPRTPEISTTSTIAGILHAKPL